MSRLSADRLYVSIAPDALGVVRVRGRFRPVVVSSAVVPCAPVQGPRPWEGAVARLGGAIGTTAGSVTVVLSNAFVRYAVVPCDAAVSGDEEELALARFHFARIHGERAKTWELRLGEVQGGSRLASAVDPQLIAAVRAAFPAAGPARLASIQPYLMAAYNKVRRTLARTPGWLVLMEHERASLSFATAQGWHSVQSARLSIGEPEALLALLERESLRTPTASPRRAFVHGGRAAAAAGWQLFQLDDSPCAMAQVAL